MRTLILVASILLFSFVSDAQKIKVPAKKYPSLLWEITGNGLKKPSYLFGTMHVSSKMAFHLSDSFYIGLKNADVVALETDMSSWQEDFSRYDLDAETLYGLYNPYRKGSAAPEDYFTIGTLRFQPYARMIEMALYSSPAMINNFLYRNNSSRAADFEEDTYLDMHIYQAGRKWGKSVVGVEDFDESMQLMKEAYEDAAKEKNRKERRYEFDEDLSYNKLEDAYRTGNLDWLDSINKVNSNSAAFDEKFLYKRNDIQAYSIDSILKSKKTLFVGVGAAHLPGERGVIEILRKLGYRLRPIRMTERDSRHKEEVEKIRVPVSFSEQHAADGFFTVNLPGKLYDFGNSILPFSQQQYADMSNGSYYIVSRLQTNSLMWGHDEQTVLRKIDSVMYENIPGKILSKTAITKNGYKGYEVRNRTRRGDYQRYNIFATPFEIIIFKMSGNGDYVKEGNEADKFFSSIQFREIQTGWQKWSPRWGGFEAQFPHAPVVSKQNGNWYFVSIDREPKRSYQVIRTDVHNYDFVEEDSFDLGLMEESFSSSDFIEKRISRKQTRHNGYAALDATYRYKDGSIAIARFLIKGPNYYTILAHGKTSHPDLTRFVQSFSIKPVTYGTAAAQTDTSLYFTVRSAVPLEKEKKLSMFPENLYSIRASQDEDEMLQEQTTYKYKLVASDSTGEKVFITFKKPSRYYFDADTVQKNEDTTQFKTGRMDWKFLSRKRYRMQDSTRVFEYALGDPRSSRYVWGKLYTRDGIEYRLEAEADTVTKPSAFLTEFFNSFLPSDTVKGTKVRERKSALFFQDFFSTDTLQHRRAVKNVQQLEFENADLPQLRKAIASLSWKEKKYLDVKKDFIWSLSTLGSAESAAYLKELYQAAGDTIELQYVVLETLLGQQTRAAFDVFRDIMTTDPPVLDLSLSNNANNYRIMPPGVDFVQVDTDYTRYSRSGNFMENLTDSLELTAQIFPQLLPLMGIHDYEKPMMGLLSRLVDSNLVKASDYEMYQPKFLIEAKQLLKKQIIREKSRQIEKAQIDEEDEDNYSYRNNSDRDYGNGELSLYANLLLPFWEKNSAIPAFFNQLLSSSDKRLKYQTMLALIQDKRAVPDTLFRYFAMMDEYRFELYEDLRDLDKLSLFPAIYNNHKDLAKSKLFARSSYNQPDTIAFLHRIPITHKDRKGYIYFFKYKMKKDETSWKIATAGLIPEDPKAFHFPRKLKYYEERKYDFTEMGDVKLEEETPLAEQLNNLLKKLQYAKRNSAAEFYSDEEGNRMVNFMQGFED